MHDSARPEPLDDLTLDLIDDLRSSEFRPSKDVKTTAEQLSQVRFSVDSDDRMVRVHMTAGGTLTGIEFRNNATGRLGEADLAHIVTAAIRQAEKVACTAVKTVAEQKD
ncbi:YbaB/EbfC family nucleoid-associated protein [Phytomonospora endophytica]|uniref:DNA-binding protein YbaB n=1 Tax=Phytomonospora endophytica TaxID=714109 RepID=A0A841FLV3_9ACTN|nr:YbaB/EbfC family nucleoid-associated protein [Phytomonospora endophytica]MBB6032930.1 DNA-binding protein YbaB [Phytomonospora endophytica]GIG65156.1 hypothetical protein Pen01_14510 [Phytomonospora endophytica]